MPCSRRCCFCLRAWACSFAPRLELHRVCTGLRLSRSDVPPAMSEMMWSALLAPGLPQMVQSGLPCRIMARLVRYCLVEYSGLFAMFVCAFVFLAPLPSAAVALGCEFRRVVPPRFQPVWLRPPCVYTDTIRVLVVRTLNPHLPLGISICTSQPAQGAITRPRVSSSCRVQLPTSAWLYSVISRVLRAVRDAVSHL